MIIDGMSLLWITLNPLNLQSLNVFLLAGVSLPVSDRAVSAFQIATAIINSIAIATFFDETYKAIFDHLFTATSSKNRLFVSVSTYFEIVKTISRGMLYFNCLVLLKSMINLSNFR